ncbi:type II toxin-antitoxin system RelE/ParE family toxin [Phenylobacterium sp.]|uniref:type II toxin-antitoxin system RelE family toxin n=1 Tax=Phenylobacterium sp. TaxID=1871053 RepID=UPI00271CD2A9|nr:type II toxin-antitoxin system RelE/ParE family toxin [Phenylobacterium sp.]MDO8381115.1 type II toxin-antitoxin system RelE/ParE family toxin [Phenylobacterium sp.]
MTYRLTITRDAVKALGAIQKRDRARIYERLDQLAADPFSTSGVKKLKGQDNYRLRVGDYRVLYLVEDAELLIVVVDVGHRREVYR